MDLILRHMPLAASDEGLFTNTEAIVLMEHIDSGEFSFLGLDELGEIGEWQPTWEEVEVPPQSISLALELAEDQHLTWPVLVASRQVTFAPGQIHANSYEEAIRALMNRRRQNQR
jgi:hypothetical protein